jgi:hypothetical protein
LQGNRTIGGTVTGGGTLEFSSGISTITAVTSGNLLVAGADLTLAETTKISGSLTETSGTVLLGENVSLAGVVQDEGGLLQLSGNTLSSPAVSVSGSGTISGYGTIAAAVINNGTVVAQQGVLSLGSGASGGGVFDLDGAGSLELLGSAAAVNISFLSGGGETLLLAKPGSVTSTISGFAATDTIDLLKTAATKLAYANGTLTVSGSAGTLATLDFTGSYVQANFALQSDGNGGTDIVFNPVNLTVADTIPEHSGLATAPPQWVPEAAPYYSWAGIAEPDMREQAAVFSHHIALA